MHLQRLNKTTEWPIGGGRKKPSKWDLPQERRKSQIWGVNWILQRKIWVNFYSECGIVWEIMSHSKGKYDLPKWEHENS